MVFNTTLNNTRTCMTLTKAPQLTVQYTRASGLPQSQRERLHLSDDQTQAATSDVIASAPRNEPRARHLAFFERRVPRRVPGPRPLEIVLLSACVGSEAISARTLSSCDTVSASSRCSSASVLRTARSKEEAERAWSG